MLEITGNDIVELSDVDLRSLIGLLCEAELRKAGLSTAGVTWGGHQNAKDGGIDVRVDITTPLHNDSYIPRAKVGFQVKKPDMPRTSIINEMRTEGELKQVIKELIDASGAYIIVSSQGSTADSSLLSRKSAMQEAISDYPQASNIKVDFYDRERIAAWVRSHPSLILWVRDKIGRPIQGWRAYENWTRSQGGLEEEYMLDAHIRLYNSANHRSDGLSAIDGINEIRNILHQPSSSVRLVGLSGVGKTRLIQALFDERLGESPLNRSQVFYSDITDSPNPDPRNFAERLIALQLPTVLVIDNCPPDLHRRLTSVCSASGSLVSLITVEYDVREDQPEETVVFRLEPSSTELIEKVISVRFNHISQVNARTIAEFSGGNARIAIALANRIQQGENVANLRDDELFLRLFQQRNEHDKSLLKSAEVCSLVYSFDGQTVEGSNAELKILSSLAGMSISEMYENISELKRRDLIQQRSMWRAVLPHAIANRLAKRALENIPQCEIINVFEGSGSERLLKSFSRRIGYLHDCDIAVEISNKWLSEDGILKDISRLNELGMEIFDNIAPIEPSATLSAIERISTRDDAQSFFSRENNHYNKITRLLRSLAYDKELFERSTRLLVLFALSENPKENYNSIRELLKSLFYIYLSGTHATPEQRLQIISELVESNLENWIELGVFLLDASLESWHFSSLHDFEFGARSRDYGFTPESSEDIRNWYKLYIEYIVYLAVSELSIAAKAKSLLAKHFRGLWIKAKMYDELETAAKIISSKDNWKEGWIAVRTTKRFDGKDMQTELNYRLDCLDSILKPNTLIEKAKLYALSSYNNSINLLDTVEEQEEIDDYSHVEKITQSLGYEVGLLYDDIFNELLPDILSSDGARLFSFGQGLADGCSNPEKMWRDFHEQLSLIEESKRNYMVLRGFLNALQKKDENCCEAFLNETVSDNILAIAYPYLQTGVKINKQGVERLKKSLDIEVSPIWQYNNLAYGRVHETIEDCDFCELLRMIASKPKGIEVSIEILNMRLHGRSEGNILSDEIIYIGQELLLKHGFTQKDNKADQIDYKLAKIIKACLAGETGEETARVLCNMLAEAILKGDVNSMDYDYVLGALAAMKPETFLDAFLGRATGYEGRIKWLFSDAVRSRTKLITHISDEIVINWCDANPNIRYPIVASNIVPFRKSNTTNLYEWTPLALQIVNNSPDPILALNEFKSSLRPKSWSGSLAEIMSMYLGLISVLKNHESSEVANWANNEEKVFEKEICSEREWEIKRESEHNERFE